MTTIVGIRVDATSYSNVMDSVLEWVAALESRYVCVGNVHMIMEAKDSPIFKDILNNADLVTPDGMPLVWMMRLKKVKGQERVYGPTLMLHVLESAARENIPIGFYGALPDTLDRLIEIVKSRYVDLNIAFSMSPPYRELSTQEDDEIVMKMNQSGVRILFVGLGCPKQEQWMAAHRGRVNAVMLGVGAAFDFHAGIKSQAPLLLQSLGLEWMFRLATEPRRLWKRYLHHNPRFVVLAIADLLGFTGL